MRVPFIDTKAQYQDLKSLIDGAIEQVISSGIYVLGPFNQSLERQLAALHGVKHAISVNSGTDALRIMLDANNIGPGDEVITSAFTFVSSIETIVQVGAKPVMVDIDLETFNIDPKEIEKAITPKTKAIMPIHLFGQLADMDALSSIAERYGLIILEDAAQAVGSQYKGFYPGHFSKAAALSFYVTKNLGAAGDGGMILTNSDQVAERCRSLRVHGMGKERYYYDDIGYASRLAEIQAAILSVKLTKFENWDFRNSEIASIYDRLLQDTNLITPKTLSGNKHTWHQYTIRTQNRDELQSYLKEKGVQSMVYYPVPLNLHKPYEKYGPAPGVLKNTEVAAKQVLSLPIHPNLNDEQVEYTAECVNEFSLQRVLSG